MAPIVGIDLGTTNSLVAHMDKGAPRCLAGREAETLLPSVVSLDADGTIVVGQAARQRLLTQPERTIYSVKRLMGRGVEDIQDELKFFPFRIAPGSESVIRVELGEKVFTPPEISALILRELKRIAEAHFGEEVTKAVITVPAYFNDAQRQATKDAGRIAGLEVLRLVNEPTAASLAYGLEKRREGLIAVYDLGGGTFDISILKLKEGIFEVLATNGDTHLGGDDIDNLMLQHALAEIRERLRADLAGEGETVQSLRKVLLTAKHELSRCERTRIIFALPGGRGRYERELTRAEFETWIAPIVARTVGPCRTALADARLTREQVDEVVLVGGATRTPLVRRTVEELFGRAPHSELNPDEVVALGAAVQADILEGGVKDMLLLDVTPLSLGIETMGGVVSKIIPRNSTIPASAAEMFTTFVDGQTNILIHVLQGERELVKDCRSLARFELRGIPSLPAGLPRLEVKFLIDANGILSVTARELHTGQEQSIEVKPSYGLSDEEVERMILESFEHAEADLTARQLIEARNEADSILAATEKSIEREEFARLEDDERREIERALDELRAARQGEDYKLIRERIDKLNQATYHLAEVMMDGAVQAALKGKSLDEVT